MGLTQEDEGQSFISSFICARLFVFTLYYGPLFSLTLDLWFAFPILIFYILYWLYFLLSDIKLLMFSIVSKVLDERAADNVTPLTADFFSGFSHFLIWNLFIIIPVWQGEVQIRGCNGHSMPNNSRLVSAEKRLFFTLFFCCADYFPSSTEI